MRRRFLVWLTAWALRHGATADELEAGLAKGYRHRTPAWRSAVLEDARERNRARLMKRVNA